MKLYEAQLRYKNTKSKEEKEIYTKSSNDSWNDYINIR